MCSNRDTNLSRDWDLPISGSRTAVGRECVCVSRENISGRTKKVKRNLAKS